MASDLISTHTPLAGRDTAWPEPNGAGKISTHTPLAGRDLKHRIFYVRNAISTHTPLAGRDQRLDKLGGNVENFYSHAPCGT